MDLQAERLEAKHGQAVLHDLKGRHLLRHKEHPLATRQRVGDEQRDRLRLACARRPVQDEALSVHDRLLDGKHLGGIGLRGEQQRGWVDLLARIDRLGRPREVPFHHRVDDLVVAQVVLPVADVAPHDELGEREEPNHAVLEHLPALLLHHLAEYRVEDETRVNAGVVGGQGVEPVD